MDTPEHTPLSCNITFMNITKTIANLNPEQKAAVLHTTGPLMLIAGAGSGKTRVIITRIAYLIEQGVEPSNILALTFTNKAAKEMTDRVSPYCKKKKPMISTFHSFGYYLLKKYHKEAGLSSLFTVYDTNDRTQLVANILEKHQFPTLQKNKEETPSAYGLVQRISQLKSNILPNEYNSDDLQKLCTHYDESLSAFHAVDFDDLIIKPIVLLQQNPEILDAVQAQFSHVMVDEYQDTSYTQFNLMEMLTKTPHNICVVGDDDQSIYSWRGADLKNWTRFTECFPKYKEIILHTSYRCSPLILNAANAVIATGERMRNKALTSHQTQHNNNTIPTQNDPPITILSLEDEYQEAEYISDIADTHHNDGIPWSEIGILTRTNALFRNIEVALHQLKIPYTVSGGTSFFERTEIKDILAYLRVLHNFNDTISLRRIINVPKRGLGITTLQQISNYADTQHISLYNACIAASNGIIPEIANAAQKNCADFLHILHTHKEKLEQGVSLAECTREIIKTTEYHHYLATMHSKHPKIITWKQENVKRLVEIISELATQHEHNHDIVNTLSHRMIQDTSNKKDDAISLMTIHAAKGLEKRVILIAGVEDGILPHSRSVSENQGAIQEEIRLCYVAITRAKTHLYITWCRSRKNARTQRKMPQIPSPFIKAIPTDIVTQELPVINKDQANEKFDKLADLFT